LWPPRRAIMAHMRRLRGDGRRRWNRQPAPARKRRSEAMQR
jgi:hypothetical protein